MKAIVCKSFPQRLLPILLSASALLSTLLPAGAIIDTNLNLQIQLGNPTGATADTNNHHHYLIKRTVEAIDYNDSMGQPNWASWDLTTADRGDSGYSGAFATDTDLPSGFTNIPPSTYGSIGGQTYDRGHMCPSADRTVSPATNKLVFRMSNMIPQASLQNQQVWADFENYCRSLLSTQELLIMCGPYNFGPNRLDSGHVGVASNTWKIAVGVPLSTDTNSALSRITNANPNSIRVIALEIPNTDAVAASDWTTFITSAKQIQTDTGYNFFSALPNNLAWVLRSKVDGHASPAPGSIGFSPASGASGVAVTVTGTNLDTVTNLTFNGTVASYTITSPTQITATVPAAATSGSITVQGLGGNATSASSFTVGPDLTIVTSHSDSFTQGDTSDLYSIIVTNAGGSASSGTVMVVDSLPAGLTATDISGDGWTTDLGTLTCTRSDALAAGAAYPPITVTVNVAAAAAASVTNTVTVSGGGDVNPANNTVGDATTINVASAPTATTDAPGTVGTTFATLKGTINPNGQPATVQFEYGNDTSYGSVFPVSGTLTGTTPQAVSANITGLVLGTVYHYRVAATNVLGSANGLDQTFTTPIVDAPDLAITATHGGTFTQGDTGDTYTILIANVGSAASSGTVTVVDTLPTGLTATAIGGDGWTVDLGTLTCTRSDALAAGAAYPPITVTVSVAADAAANLTNLVSVSGGGDLSPANNTASDPTTINAAAAPTVATSAATSLGITTATLNGTVNPNSQTATAHFDYGLTTSYGSTASVSGTFAGATVQAVSANITGLAASTLYHFRLAATNVLGSGTGLDQMFTTSAAEVPDLAITATHSSAFTQGDTADTYTLMITNVGTAASSGAVSVVDTLPAGLTATAITGTGWTTDLGSLTCTRSDALAAGAAYPPILVLVNVAADAPASVTNTAMVSGGGEANLANNAASDPTTINPFTSGSGLTTLVGWDVHGLASYGASPFAPTTNAAALTIVAGLTRGTGVGTSGTAAGGAWGGNSWTDTSSANAITANRFATFAVAASIGYKVSFASISKFDYRHSPTGPPNGLLQYQIGSGAFANIATLSYSSSSGSGASLSPIDLSGISALQDVGAGTNVTFRIVNWGGTNPNGTWYVYDVGGTTAPDLAVQGAVSPVIVPTADLAVSVMHTGTFTQGDTSDTYTITVTNNGTAATVGTVSLIDALPAGLTATAIDGSGWTANLTSLTCVRSDALAPGASYPPITVTVNISAGAPASVTNIANVSGGGDMSPANNTAGDPTTVNAAAAPTVATDAATAVGAATATLNGTVNPNSQTATVYFDYGLTTDYGSIASVSGTFTGATAQAVSAIITGLAADTLYHFRAVAINVLDSANGLDQTFTTTPAPVPDLAIAATHSGSFTQGDTSDYYTIIVTNAGTTASSGTVTVVDTLPTGLTAIAISGDGWATNLDTLVCTRSDALVAGAAYPPITVTVSVAADAAANLTNVVSVSGGGDLSPANNTAGDPTLIDVATAPAVTTDAATAVNITTATLNGTVNPNSQTATAHFDYGLTTDYGSTASVSGTFAGATVQAVSANITGLAADTLYHFRAVATNVLGSANGLDQTFITLPAPVPDFAITATHSGDFTQGDTADTYIILITNVGSAASSDTVTVVDTLPNGLTATAIGGDGWTADLGTLTCTRSDALAARASYPPITVTVSVSADAPASLTNTALALGGGDVNLGDNTSSDPTTILPAAAPMVSTDVASAVGCNAATLNGYVNPNGQPTTAQFQYGLSASYGSVLTVPDCLSGTTTQAVATCLSELLPGTTYHFRLAATNVLGATIGQDQVFTTLAPIEAWRLQWFGTTANSGAAADTAVATSDRMPNLLKYALGLNPLVATNNPVVCDVCTGYLRLTSPKNPDATDVSFQVEVTDNLTTTAWTTNGTTVDVNSPTLLEVHANTPVASSTEAFIRLRVSSP